ncbi:hypothetical protein C5O19_15530 [Siphonobacter curvatus]|uniref:Uncharacterized protein n=1 Tax=Siphonobacter curvatus TaxID=2094562 RepID=A0A2S7IJH4_9BACT|nr:hypothetical protein C5O19_15530 [Siphonobacter curvatus]
MFTSVRIINVDNLEIGEVLSSEEFVPAWVIDHGLKQNLAYLGKMNKGSLNQAFLNIYLQMLIYYKI